MIAWCTVKMTQLCSFNCGQFWSTQRDGKWVVACWLLLKVQCGWLCSSISAGCTMDLVVYCCWQLIATYRMQQKSNPPKVFLLFSQQLFGVLIWNFTYLLSDWNILHLTAEWNVILLKNDRVIDFLCAKAATAFSTSQPSQFCLCVCLSITQVDQSKMVQARITKSSPSAAWKILVSGSVKLFHKFEGGHFEWGR